MYNIFLQNIYYVYFAVFLTIHCVHNNTFEYLVAHFVYKTGFSQVANLINVSVMPGRSQQKNREFNCACGTILLKIYRSIQKIET